MNKGTFTGNFLRLLLSGVLLFAGCADKTIYLGNIDPPPVNNRLRVYFKVISDGSPRVGWKKTESEVESMMTPMIAKTFEDSGVCDLVSIAELATVWGDQQLSGGYWLRDHLQLARQVGQALYADYGILMERHVGSFKSVRYLLVNVHTGTVFEVSAMDVHPGSGDDFFRSNIRPTWKRLYRMARKDLLTAALRKGRKESPLPSPAVDSPIHLVEKAESEPEASLPPAKDRDLPALAIYDFNSDESMRTAAVILADALREEVLKRGKALLVNRENIGQVLQEMAISQLGLTDERQALTVGKALAARQIVTGQLGVLGNQSILQIKRVEVEAQKTGAVVSARSPKGQEDVLLDAIPGLAQDILRGL